MSTATNLDGVDPFAGIANTNPVVAKKKSIDNDVEKLKKVSSRAIEADSTQNYEGIVKVKPKDPTLDETLNDYQSEVLNNINRLQQDRTEELKPDDLKKFVKVEDGRAEVVVPKVDVMKDLSDVLGFNVQNNEAMQDDLGDAMFDTFKDLTYPDGGELLTKNGEELSFNRNWREGTTEGLVMALGLAGLDIYKEVRDSAIEEAFDASSLYQAVKNGMIESYRPIYEKIDGKEKKDKMIVESIQYALANGDWYSLKELTSIAGSSLYPNIKARYPTLVRTYMTNYRLNTKKDHQKDYRKIVDETIALFKAIYGEDYLKINTSFGMVYDGSIGSTASQDAITVYSLNDELGMLLTLKGVFQINKSFDVFLSHFPNTPVLN